MNIILHTSAQNLKVPAINREELAVWQQVLMQFLDLGTTATARATYYNTREEIEKAAAEVHQRLYSLDKGLYGMMLLLPGMNNFTRQLGLRNLLSKEIKACHSIFLNDLQEKKILLKLIELLPPHRLLNTMVEFKERKINSARSRNVILHFLLGGKKLDWWSVKYRHKVRMVLVHAWGEHTSGILASILKKNADERNKTEAIFLSRNIDKYINSHVSLQKVYDSIGFVLNGRNQNSHLDIHAAFRNASMELESGAVLPYEVLEGLRSTYHKNRTNAEVLALTSSQLTRNQKIIFQRKSEEQEVKIEVNFLDYDGVKLYTYAFERGMSDEISKALKTKAKEAASQLPYQFGRIGILVDTSASMLGNNERRLHPISSALALRDMLAANSSEATICYSNHQRGNCCELVHCGGATSPGESLLELLSLELDTIFILSDGYENAPSGRVGEITMMARKAGIKTPVIHLSPVAAAESGGIHTLGEAIESLPVNRPEALAPAFVKSVLQLDFERGLSILLSPVFNQFIEPELKKKNHVQEPVLQ